MRVEKNKKKTKTGAVLHFEAESTWQETRKHKKLTYFLGL